MSKLRTSVPSTCEMSSTKPHPPKADAWPLVSLSTYQRVPSPKSIAWAGPYARGRTHLMPTSTRLEPATHPAEAINGHYRTRQTYRQRLPQPHQRPTPNAPLRRRPRRLPPHSALKSPLTDDSLASVYSRTPLDDELQRAHHALDAAVDRLFGIDDPSTDQRERRLIQWYLKISW